MKVWIDQDLCTGDGLCVEICPSLFDMHDDGLAYVKEADWNSLYGPDAPRTDKSILSIRWLKAQQMYLMNSLRLL